jgi:hypothetical protein
LKRRAGALDEAAARMELEAKATLLRRWRGQAPRPVGKASATRAEQVPYRPRQVLHRLRPGPQRTLAALLDLPEPAEPTTGWTVLAFLQPRTEGLPGPTASTPRA